MKTIFLALVLTAMCLYSSANIITVSNRGNSPGQYKTLLAGYNAASSGDTIYLSGSTSNYGSLTVSKSITIIGAGFNAGANKQDVLTTVLDGFTIAANNCSFIGLNFSQYGTGGVASPTHYSFLLNQSVSGLSIIKCQQGNIGGWASAPQYFIELNGGNGSSFSNFAINGCRLVNYNGNHNSAVFDDQNSSNCAVTQGNISNNFISEYAGSGSTGYLTNTNLGNEQWSSDSLLHNTFETDINGQFFYGKYVNCLFNDNIFYGQNYNTTALMRLNLTGTNTGNTAVNNTEYTNSGQSNITDFNTAVSSNYVNFIPGYDYNSYTNGVYPTDPFYNAATDGTQVGAAGGSKPYNFIGEPSIPQILNISAPSVTGASSISVSVKTIANQ